MKEDRVIVLLVLGGLLIWGKATFGWDVFVAVTPIVTGILFLLLVYELYTTLKEYLQMQIDNQNREKEGRVEQTKIQRQIYEMTHHPMPFESLINQIKPDSSQDPGALFNSIEMSLMEMVKDGILIHTPEGYVHKA